MGRSRRHRPYRLVILRDDPGWKEEAEQAGGTVTISGWMDGEGAHEWTYRVPAEHVPALVIALGGQPGDDVLTLLQQYVAEHGRFGHVLDGLATFTAYWDG
jgi:hypothetical protein